MIWAMATAAKKAEQAIDANGVLQNDLGVHLTKTTNIGIVGQ